MQLCIIRKTSKGNLDLSVKLHSQWLSFSSVFFCWPLQWMNWDQWGTGNEFMHHKQHQKLAHNQPLSLMSPWFSCMACMSSELTCVTLSAEDEAVFYLTPLPFWFGLFWPWQPVYFMQMQFGQEIDSGLLIHGSQIVETLGYTTYFHPCVHRFGYPCLPVKKLCNGATDSRPKPTGWTLNRAFDLTEPRVTKLYRSRL